MKAIVDNVATQTVNKVESIIETKIPFQKINDLAGMSGAVQSFKTAEKRIMKVFSELEGMRTQISDLEREDRKIEALLFGFTREQFTKALKESEELQAREEAVQKQIAELQ